MPFRTSVISSLLLILAAFAHANPRTLTLPSPAVDVAIDSATGTIAAVDPARPVVMFYPTADAAKPTEVQVGATPVCVVHKQVDKASYFVVASFQSSELTIFDATTQKEVKRVRLPGQPTAVAASLNPKDPYVYYCLRSGVQGKAGRYNLAAWEDEGSLTWGEPDFAVTVQDCAVNPDGTILYKRGGSGFQVYEIQPRTDPKAQPSAKALNAEQKTSSMDVIDPSGQRVAVGDRIYSADLQRELDKAPHRIIAFAPSSPTIITVDPLSRQVVSVSSNTLKPAKRVPLPTEMTGDLKRIHDGNGRTPDAISQVGLERRYRFQALFDPSHQRVLLCYAETIAIVPYEEILCSEPTLSMVVGAPPPATPGVVWSMDLPAPDKGVQVTIDKGPAGVKIEGNRLTWTPTTADVGIQAVTLKLAAGELARTQEFAVKVALPYAQLPFVPDLVSISPDAKFAIVGTIPGWDREKEPRESTIAIVDLATSKVIATRKLPYAIAALAVDSTYAYMGSQISNAFYVLKHEDLSEVKRMFAPAGISTMDSVGGRLFVGTTSGRALALSLKTFEEDPGDLELGAVVGGHEFLGDRISSPMPQRFGDGYVFNHFLYDAGLAKPQQLFTTGRLIDIVDGQQLGGFELRDNRLPVNPWDVMFNGRGLVRSSGQSIAAIDSPQQTLAQPEILPTMPALAELQMKVPRTRSERTIATLLFHDLVSGRIVSEVKLFEDQLKPMDPHRYHDGVRLVAADEAPRLVAVVQDRLCAVDFSDLKLDRPIILARPTGPLLVEPDKETTFDLKADGGKPPYRYSLTVEVPGVTMDEKTGRITIKPNELSPAAVKQLANTIMRTDRYRGGLVSARFGAYRQEAAGVFKKLLGRDPAGTPMALTLSVQAEDKERMNTRIRLVAIVDVPKGAIDAAVEQQKADEAKERAARLPAQPDDDAPVTNSTSDQKRIKELEAEVEALNAKVDLLTDLLKARLAPATQP